MDFSGFTILEILLEKLSLGLQGVAELWWVLSHNQAPTSSLLIALCNRWGRESEQKKHNLGVEIKTKRGEKTKADTHHFPPADWCPAVSKQWLFCKDFPSAIAEHDVLWHGRALDQCGSAVSSVPSHSPAHSQPTCWGTDWETEKIWKLCEHCLAIAKPQGWDQHCFSHKSKAWHHMGC